MGNIGSDYLLEVIRLEHEERLRQAERRRLAASARTPGQVRRLLGRALVRLGLLLEGRSGTGHQLLVPAHRGGLSR